VSEVEDGGSGVPDVYRSGEGYGRLDFEDDTSNMLGETIGVLEA
jgi:hypothetical protein